jgi:hypothetical protein
MDVECLGVGNHAGARRVGREHELSVVEAPAPNYGNLT